MTPERIKTFLRCFYEQYILKCYEGYDIDDPDNEDLLKKMEQYDVTGYFLKHLDIYIENADFLKEYNILYNSKLFHQTKETNPDDFNDLQIFLIENIQLFLYAILEAAINSTLKPIKITGLQLYVKPVDNKEIKLLDLIDLAEAEMKKLNVLPPAMG